VTQSAQTATTGQDEASGRTGALRLAPEGAAPAPAPAPPARRAAPRKRATPAPAVVDLAAAERAAAVPEEALASALSRSLRAQLPALLDDGLQGALAPLARELATAFADVEFSVQRTTVLETRAGVAEARATAAEHRARTAEDRLDATRARAALLDDQVAALRAELADRPRGLFRRRRGPRV
jgi:hypothetical protein